MTDPSKTVKNPLLNASVTGGTFEEFSQNAVLLPARERTPSPPSELNLAQTQEQISGSINFEPYQNQIDSQGNIQHEQNYQFQELIQEPLSQISAIETDDSKLENHAYSSIFSSFSNILNLKGNNKSVEPELIFPSAAKIELPEPTADPEAVPLYPTTANTFVDNSLKLPSKSQGPANSYRRSDLRKAAYAPAPGLSGVAIQKPPIYQNPNLSSQSYIPADISKSSPAYNISSSHFLNSVQTNYSQPANTIPTTISSPESFINPTGPIQSQSNLFNTCPRPSSSTSFQSPVMAAIPASEFLDRTNLEGFNNINTNPNNGENLDMKNAANTSNNQTYRPVYHHWFHKKEIEGKTIWLPFSMVDSLALEQGFTSNDLDPDKVVATDGGRYDVNILRRQRNSIYWSSASTEVRRCSWFHKGSLDGKYQPYEENVATKLEEEFKIAFETNHWHHKVELLNGDTIVFHAPDVLVLFPPTQSPDAWGNTPNQQRPRVVKRGMDEFDIDEGEPPKVDHLLFLVHGIGSVCDLKFRTVEEVVDEFRSVSLQLVQTHYRSSCEKGAANRIEVLPISWHDDLHTEDTDRKLQSITLKSIPRLRNFTNDTILDVLFYTSPVYCQRIISAVGNQLNRTFDLFKQRNPDFNGGVSLGGHSLGSLILFDLLCHQYPEPERQTPTPPASTTCTEGSEEDILSPLSESESTIITKRKLSRRISYMMGAVGTGQPQIHYPHLNFQPNAFFALGSPIGMFVTVRGLDSLGEHFSLPTCPAFFNIFHPYDPVAYRVESLVNPELSNLKPVLIPHHKGRKRMHLELKETMARVGADIKQKVFDSMKTTWNSFYQLAMFHKQDQNSLEAEVDKAITEQLVTDDTIVEELEQTTNLPLGALNKGRRIDYVLQEAPFEIFNEYIFALTSHVCYWDSEDTMLLILKEIYSSIDISPDSKMPQQTMTIERPPLSPKLSKNNLLPTNYVSSQMNMDPTTSISPNTTLAPPPMTGFVKKT